MTFADKMPTTVVIDGRGHLLGRLASTIAKEVLNGTSLFQRLSSAVANAQKARGYEGKQRKWRIYYIIRNVKLCGHNFGE